MIIYTIGFTQKSARDFFTKIAEAKAELLLDVRLNSNSQLSGFAKERDLPYFLSNLCNCDYFHAERFAPTKALLTEYKKGKISWQEYIPIYCSLYTKRNMREYFQKKTIGRSKIVLLCSEATPEHCHRRLLAEMLARDIQGVTIKHLM